MDYDRSSSLNRLILPKINDLLPKIDRILSKTDNHLPETKIGYILFQLNLPYN